MEFLNPQIAKLAKAKKPSLARKTISCGIFQEIEIKNHPEISPEKGNGPNQE